MSEEAKSGQPEASESSQESNHYGLHGQSVGSERSARSSHADDEETTALAPEESMDKQAMVPLLERFPDLADLDNLDDAQQVELLGKVLTGLQQDLEREGK